MPAGKEGMSDGELFQMTNSLIIEAIKQLQKQAAQEGAEQNHLFDIDALL
jgi:hypothetical protein